MRTYIEYTDRAKSFPLKVRTPVTHTQPFSLQWYPEVTHFCKGVPIIVVGCKIDLRKDKVLVNTLRKKRLEPVTYHRVGRKLAVDERHLGREPQDTSLLCQAFSTLRVLEGVSSQEGSALGNRTQNTQGVLTGQISNMYSTDETKVHVIFDPSLQYMD